MRDREGSALVKKQVKPTTYVWVSLQWVRVASTMLGSLSRSKDTATLLKGIDLYLLLV